MNPPSKQSFSVVTPLFNEVSNLSELYRRLSQTLDSLKSDYEIIFVDDGSHDGTLAGIQELSRRDPRIKYLSFSRNFGHQNAVTAGLDYAEGSAVIVLDADLQDPPELIPDMIQKWRDGYQVVYGVRRNRKESFFLRTAYYAFYRILQRISDVSLPADAGDFCLMDQCVVKTLRAMPERNRYIRGIRAWMGYRQTGLEYDRPERAEGESKYSVFKLMKLAVTGMTAFSNLPLIICGYIGFFIALLSFLGLFAAVSCKFLLSQTIPLGWASLISAIFFTTGIQLIMLSVVGTYVGRIYHEVQQRPLYLVREYGNLAPKATPHNLFAAN